MPRPDDHAYKGYSVRVNRMSDIVWVEKEGHTITTFSGVSEDSINKAHEAIDAITANPHPKGWTEGEEDKRDRCVRELVREGVPAPKTAEQRERSDRQRAFAICTAAVEHSRSNGNPDVMTYAREVVDSLKLLFGVV